jgi:hypothetical protein
MCDQDMIVLQPVLISCRLIHLRTAPSKHSRKVTLTARYAEAVLSVITMCLCDTAAAANAYTRLAAAAAASCCPSRGSRVVRYTRISETTRKVRVYCGDDSNFELPRRMFLYLFAVKLDNSHPYPCAGNINHHTQSSWSSACGTNHNVAVPLGHEKRTIFSVSCRLRPMSRL